MSSIADILNRIDSGDYAMPQFQRGYVWNRNQVRRLMTSLYKGYPVGTLLLWQTPVEGAAIRGEGSEGKQGVVNLILDGQQRMTTLYGVMRGKEPPFFEGDSRAFTGLMFNVEDESFEFRAPKMRDDPMWVSVTDVYSSDAVSTALTLKDAAGLDNVAFTSALQRLNRIEQIKQTDILSETVTGPDKTVDVVVEIFNGVNSGGTKLSKGDLTLAKICAEWPEMRDEMQSALDGFAARGYSFTRDWLLRCLTVHLAKSAYFSALDAFSVEQVRKGLKETVQIVGTCLDHIAGRLGLDHTRVLGSPFSIPIMIAAVDQAGGKLDALTWDRLLYWHVHVFLWGRYAGSTESVLAQDLNAVKAGEGVEGLLRLLRSNRPDLALRADDFWGWSTGARFYPLMYLLARMGRARDWGSGIELNSWLLGKNSGLEVHHIFPKKVLYDSGRSKSMVNQLANYAFLTKQTNDEISDKFPRDYLPGYIEGNPGAVESHVVPTEDPSLFEVGRYEDFLARRRELLAEKANGILSALYQGKDLGELLSASGAGHVRETDEDAGADGFDGLLDWLSEQGYAGGVSEYGVNAGPKTEIVDMAWPDGLQTGLGDPVALMVDSTPEARSFVQKAGYRVFESAEALRAYAGGDRVGGE